MKQLILLFILVPYCYCFMNLKDLNRRLDLKECYDKQKDRNQMNREEGLPLPLSIETFISLIETLEIAQPNRQPSDILLRLLTQFRADGTPPKFDTWGSIANTLNSFEKAFFTVPDSSTLSREFEELFSKEERCALHLMLSHTFNDTALQGDDVDDKGRRKQPFELGVVSLGANSKHAFALDRVLLGVLAGMMGNNEVDAASVCAKINMCQPDETLTGLKVNRLISLTLGDLISVYVAKTLDRQSEKSFQPNGLWMDNCCTTDYVLEKNDNQYTSNSLLRGAVDGLVIGRKLEERPVFFRRMRLSSILRMYYGPTGLIEDETGLKSGVRSDLQWCSRDRQLNLVPNLRDEVLNFHKLYMSALSSTPPEDAPQKIEEVLSFIRTSPDIFSDVRDGSPDCASNADTTPDKRCTTPSDIFAITDWTANEQIKEFQIQVIGNLSVGFPIRPSGSSLGLYTNMRPVLNKGLDTIANNTGISGRATCFARHYSRSTSRISEMEVFENLNRTLTDFSEEFDERQMMQTEIRSGANSKVILYFNYQNPTDDYKLREALWEIKSYFREATVLAVGSKKESLRLFTENEDTDIFTETTNAEMFANKLRQRICKVPAEFRFPECSRSSRSTEAENKQGGFIALNKKQYWAMYPKYFLKSFGLALKFRAQDGAKIRVCFTRSYYRIIEDNAQYIDCQESTGEEIKFTTSNPCYRRSVNNCDPFYFSIEGKQAPNSACDSIKCSSPKDIQFEFEHEGISCNGASFTTVSIATLLLAVLFIIQRQ